MKILVCGAGTMGSGIAQVLAQKGHLVYLYDIKEDLVEHGLNTIKKNMERLSEKGKITSEEKEAVLGRLVGTAVLRVDQELELVIEAIIEKMAVKRELFNELDNLCPSSTIFASNTSALSISEIAASTDRPDKFIGMHFFNPAPVMKLVEIIKGAATSEATYLFIKKLAAQLGKEAITVQEAPGFVVNRILIPMINEAAYILMEGTAGASDIDQAMIYGANHPIGPLALGDMIGLDVCLFIMDTLYEEMGDPKYRACPLLRKMVRAGYLGRKTKQGFFTY